MVRMRRTRKGAVVRRVVEMMKIPSLVRSLRGGIGVEWDVVGFPERRVVGGIILLEILSRVERGGGSFGSDRRLGFGGSRGCG